MTFPLLFKSFRVNLGTKICQFCQNEVSGKIGFLGAVLMCTQQIRNECS